MKKEEMGGLAARMRDMIHAHGLVVGNSERNRFFLGRRLFARSNTGVVDSDPTRGMDVCVRLFCVYVVLCVGSGLATG
jgi:hypothetical protein